MVNSGSHPVHGQNKEHGEDRKKGSMNIAELFIRRPIMTTLVMLAF